MAKKPTKTKLAPLLHETRTVNGHTVQVYVGDIPYQVCKDLARASRLAVDIETTGPDRDSLLDWSRGNIALVTLYAKGQTPVLLRPLAMERPNWLCALLWDEGVQKVLHYARFDLSFIMHHWQVRAANIACTRMAAKFCGFEAEQRSLKSQLDYFLDLQPAKTEVFSDWTAPTLTDAQIGYALDDVTHLDDLLDAQTVMLREKDLLADYEAYCAFLPTYLWIYVHGGEPDQYFVR